MSKGLEALREYKRITCPNCQYYHLEEKCNIECFSNIIEKELKDKEKFEELVNMDLDLFMKAVDIKGLIEDYQKFKKVLEIIKAKVGIHWFQILDLWLKTKLINQEEYNLLKEVML